MVRQIVAMMLFEYMWITGNGNNKRELSYVSLLCMGRIISTHYQRLFDDDVELNSHSLRHASLTNYNNGTHDVLKELGKESLTLIVLKLDCTSQFL
jgi:hypothetical protein